MPPLAPKKIDDMILRGSKYTPMKNDETNQADLTNDLPNDFATFIDRTIEIRHP